ncbi:hypothetical protein ACFXEL_23555 [Streptomyces sp. NPDC059382]|uniref:hypothetical protein n=1 Tax=Streptomyces sp. NPDC059382 TaxID=3346816 RepID=UPI00367B06E2
MAESLLTAPILPKGHALAVAVDDAAAAGRLLGSTPMTYISDRGPFRVLGAYRSQQLLGYVPAVRAAVGAVEAIEHPLAENGIGHLPPSTSPARRPCEGTR